MLHTCATLKATARADPASVLQFAESMMSRFSKLPQTKQTTETIDVVFAAETTTEPDTLVPYRLWTETRLVVTGLENGKRFEQSKAEQREWIFSCR